MYGETYKLRGACERPKRQRAPPRCGEGAPSNVPEPPKGWIDSAVVVEVELARAGTQPDVVDLVQLLVLDPRVDQVHREHVALEQEVVVGAQGVERAVE